MAEHRQLQHQHEFLPLCDVLFNIISLTSYFCDIVFDFAMIYALAHHSVHPTLLFPLSVTLVVSSLFISQIVSLRWYLWGPRGKLRTSDSLENCETRGQRDSNGKWAVKCVLFLHSTQIGVLWRYFKLFVPVDLTYVKHEVRELCVLRLIHAFCEAAPMLLLQLYLLSVGIGMNMETENDKLEENEDEKLAKLTAVSAGLSLWSVCWAVASFSKGAARLRNLERLVLTWLGVLAQLAWRLGTVSARVGALVVYASLYGGQGLLVVMALHWLSMVTWLLLNPDGIFNSEERLSFLRKTFIASLLAYIYIFAYVNFHETNHRQKMAIFYTVMFLENSLLIGVWVVGMKSNNPPRLHNPQPITLVFAFFALFFSGMFFMGLYYRFFHVRRLRYEAGGRMTSSHLTTCSNHDNIEDKQIDPTQDKRIPTNVGTRKVKSNNGGIPGVFNCRFTNPTVVNPNRKKKKPTTFVPLPPLQTQPLTPTTTGDSKQWLNGNCASRQLIPFWKRPLSPKNEALNDQRSDNEFGNGGSLNINLIREKLREKKQQQLRELKAIQEEIREGKLFPPPSASTSFSSSISASTQRPPPNTKLHTPPCTQSATPHPLLGEHNGGTGLSSWPPVKMHCLLPPPPSSHISNSWRIPQRERAETPEILLAPRCLPLHYFPWTSNDHNGHRMHMNQNGEECNSKGEEENEGEISDIEGSQVSLPRSYTLPREFKYHHTHRNIKERREGNGKIPSSRFYLPSNNSSDGDVDSADNEEETDSEIQSGTKNHAPRNNYENNRSISCKIENNETTAHPSMLVTNNCYSSNLYGVLRQHQLFRARMKHETKL